MAAAVLLLLAGCGGAGNDGAPALDPLDAELRTLIDRAGLTGDPAGDEDVPALDAPLAQLGMRLFFSKSLSGGFDVACASCHHPALAGGDSLSVSVGVAAVEAEQLGVGRRTATGAPNVARNAPTTFNAATHRRVMFHDGRVERLLPGQIQNDEPGIRTPDVPFGVPDPAAGPSLAAAQARFPVTVDVEMRGDFLAGADNAALRDRLAQRLGGYGDGAAELARNEWLPLFQAAFGDAPATAIVTFDNIALALAAYEHSQQLTDTPWRDYVGGDLAAIDASAKRGAILFLRRANEGGAGCAVCHRGDAFTDDAFHAAAFPQIGPGKGDGAQGDDDFGRERETGDPVNRYEFRTAPLLNVALTAPYGHAGAYASLADVVAHYANPQGAVGAFFAAGGWCALAQFAALPAAECAALYPNAQANSQLALQKLQQDRAGGASLPVIQLDAGERLDLVAFLGTLTDRCAADADCRRQWVPPDDGGPDGQQLRAVDAGGAPL